MILNWIIGLAAGAFGAWKMLQDGAEPIEIGLVAFLGFGLGYGVIYAIQQSG